jgi:hypothetical protein
MKRSDALASRWKFENEANLRRARQFAAENPVGGRHQVDSIQSSQLVRGIKSLDLPLLAYYLLGSGLVLLLAPFLPWYYVTDDATDVPSESSEILNGWSILTSLDVLICITAGVSVIFALIFLIVPGKARATPIGLLLIPALVAVGLVWAVAYHAAAPNRVVFGPDPFDLSPIRFEADTQFGVVVALLAAVGVAAALASLAIKVAWGEETAR